MPKALLAQTVQHFFLALGPHADPAIWDERQPPGERLDRLVDACRSVATRVAQATTKDQPRAPMIKTRLPQDPVTITRSALLDASEAALSLQAEGSRVVPDDLVSLLEHLAQLLQPPRQTARRPSV